MNVYRYVEPITAHGLVFMDAPGYDPMGATGQSASGANLVAFAKGQEIFELMLRIASGEKSKSESLGVGNEETVPWMIGAQM